MDLRTLLALTLAAVVTACGPVTPSSDAGADGGTDGGADAGRTDCDEPYRLCQYEFRFRALDEQRVELRGDFSADGWMNGVAMSRTGNTWVGSVTVPWGAAIQYKYLINNSIWINDPSNPKTVSDGKGSTNSLVEDVSCATWACTPNAPQPGAFDWRDAVIYFVFVDRFHDADRTTNCTVPDTDPAGQYQGGDWKGVTQRINEGYFNDLGVTALWLTVPLKNATVAGRGSDGRNYSAFHGYWPTSLDDHESCFGSKQDLVDLVNAAHAKGIQVTFDFAMVHVHSSAPVYAQHPEWFWPLSYNGGSCVCDDSGVCPWNVQGQRCWFTDYLPHWNYTNAAARDYSVSRAVKLVQDTGADGFRLDAIKHVDGSWLTQLRSEVETKVASARTPRPRFYMVGETYDFGSRDYIKSFVDPATKLDGQFDFPLRLKLLQAVVMRQVPMTELKGFVDSNDDFYGATALMSPWIGNHDLGRVIHQAEDSPMWPNPYDSGKDRAFTNQPQLPNYRRPFERLANAFAFLLTSRGAPLIYYGDEIGLPGAGDPDNRRFMQWSGLSADQQWLKARVAKLGALRKQHVALRRGKRQTLHVTDNTWVYSMTSGADVVYVAINRGDFDETVSGLPAQGLRDEYNDASVGGPSLSVPARSARVMVKQ